MIEYTHLYRQKLKKELGNFFIYLSDEFFIKSKTELPDSDYYDEFYQIENGVGEFRDMIDKFKNEMHLLPSGIEQPIKVTWVTGTLAAGNLEKHIISELNKIKNLEIDMVPVKNDFYGHSIEVSGLLVGQDIYTQLKNRDLGDYIFLPPRILNHDGLMLDNWSLSQLEEALAKRIHVYTESILDIVDVIRQLTINK